MSTQTAISFEEYLRHIPDPDVEYVDGHLKERPVVAPIHSVLQSEICLWFGLHRSQWKLLTGVEVRTQVTATSVLLPDVVVHPIKQWPLAEGAPQRFTQPPLIVIEVLSLGDGMAELEQKCDAYEAMGIPNIWVINPMQRKGKLWKRGTWTEVTRFEVEGTEVHLDVDWLFAQIDGFQNAE